MKQFLIILALLTSVTQACGQVTLGAKAGGNYTLTRTSLGDQAPPFSLAPASVNGFGFHGGAFVELELSEKLFLRPELSYSVRNNSYDEGFDSTIVIMGIPLTARAELEVEVTRSYLELPVLIGYKLGEHFSLVAGPAVSYLISNRTNTNGQISVGSFLQGFDLPFSNSNTSTEGLRAVGFAAVSGLNYRSEGGIDIGLRYWQGFGTLEEDTDLLKTYQSMLQLSLGYSFIGN